MNKQHLMLIGPIYAAQYYYHKKGAGHESNPYPNDTEKHLDFALEMSRLQTAELKQMINGEEISCRT